MQSTLSARRQAENEVFFRSRNERIQKNFDDIKEIAEEDGQLLTLNEIDTPLHFYCECADENCDKRVVIKHDKYNNIHEVRDNFIVIPGHEVTAIEKVIIREKKYYVVQKFIDHPEEVESLNKTEIDNR
jgi:hypothetical protein